MSREELLYCTNKLKPLLQYREGEVMFNLITQ